MLNEMGEKLFDPSPTRAGGSDALHGLKFVEIFPDSRIGVASVNSSLICQDNNVVKMFLLME